MNKKVNELWVKALRSGEFRQGQFAMLVKDRYCVLGMLSMLAMLEGVCDIEVDYEGYGFFDGRINLLPASVVEWAEMKSHNGTIKGEFLTLQGMNDIAEYDFLQLADIIEKNCEVL